MTQQIGHILNNLQIVTSRELAPAAPKPLSTGERQLAVALQEPRICQLTEVEPLKQALRYAMLLVGLREKNLPGDEEKAVLLTHLVKHYGGHTPSEIRLAFELAVSGELGVEANCYENFSVLYVSGILNAYRKWAEPAVKAVAPKPEPITYTEQQLTQMHLDWVMARAYYRLHRINLLPFQIPVT